MRKAIIAASMIAALSSGTAKADAITKQEAGGPRYLHRFATGRTVSTDTATISSSD